LGSILLLSETFYPHLYLIRALKETALCPLISHEPNLTKFIIFSNTAAILGNSSVFYHELFQL